MIFTGYILELSWKNVDRTESRIHNEVASWVSALVVLALSYLLDMSVAWHWKFKSPSIS